MTSEGSDYKHIKCTVVGDGSVGKTYMIIRYIRDVFPTEYIPTVWDNYDVTVAVGGVKYQVDVYDTAGPEDFDRLRPLAYPGTDIFLVFFSIISQASYENVADKWKPEVSHHCPTTPILLVGTKLDQRNDPDAVRTLQNYKEQPFSTEKGMHLAKKIGAVSYVECSALTGEGLKEVFEQAVKAVVMPVPKKSKSVGCFSLRSPKK